jgi:hypothetical protein
MYFKWEIVIAKTEKLVYLDKCPIKRPVGSASYQSKFQSSAVVSVPALL